MILQIFTIYDAMCRAYLKPFYDHNKGSALRGFGDEANNKESKLCQHAGDFTLFHIGEFDDQDCSIKMFDAHVPLGKALEFKEHRQMEQDVKSDLQKEFDPISPSHKG